QVLSYRRPVEDRLDQAGREVVGRPDPGQHQQLRGVVGAAAEDHLALGLEAQELAVARALDADGARSLDDNALDLESGLDRQVRALRRRMQVRDGRAATPPVALGQLVV